jgi:cell division protein FtsB
MAKWKKISLIIILVLTPIIVFCVYTMTEQAFSLVNASEMVSKRQAKIDTLENEIEDLEKQYSTLSTQIDSLQLNDTLLNRTKSTTNKTKHK